MNIEIVSEREYKVIETVETAYSIDNDLADLARYTADLVDIQARIDEIEARIEAAKVAGVVVDEV